MKKNKFFPRVASDSTLFGLDVLKRLATVATLACSLLTLAIHPALAAEERAGEILVSTGQVEILHGTIKSVPANHADLFSGDTIVTGAGQVQLRFADGTLLTLYRDTKFAVDDYHYGKGNGDRASFSLLNGVMHTLTGHIDKNSYQLKTRLANLGVRGTEYSVQLNDALHVSVDQGRVLLANAGGTVFVAAGQSVIITGQNVMPEPKLGGKIDLGMHGPGAGGHGGPLGGGSGGPGAMGGPSGMSGSTALGGSGAGAMGGAGGIGGGAPSPAPPGTQKIK